MFFNFYDCEGAKQAYEGDEQQNDLDANGDLHLHNEGLAHSSCSVSHEAVPADSSDYFPCVIVPRPVQKVHSVLSVEFTDLTLLLIDREATEDDIDCTHDIIPRKYEGGYKLWECSIDLTAYLVEHWGTFVADLNLDGPVSVVELGCGQGLPGLAALKLGCNAVYFSDYNKEVLEDITWPNIMLNISQADLTSRDVQCLSGDWSFLPEVLSSSSSYQREFSIILSAETLYSAEVAQKLFCTIQTHLKAGGLALLATKRFYFGVGGGTKVIEDLVAGNAGLACRVVKSFEDGASNIRDIIEIRKLQRL